MKNISCEMTVTASSAGGKTNKHKLMVGQVVKLTHHYKIAISYGHDFSDNPPQPHSP